jgi:FkbM family methyltransferase
MDYRPFRIATIMLMSALFFGCILSLVDVFSPYDNFIATSDTPPVFIKKTFGANWHLWDPSQDGVLFRDEFKTISCDWVNFRPAVLPDLPLPIMKSTKMCVYGEKSNDMYVSESIRENGRWGECDALSSLVYLNGNELHLEIGANIGSCILQVLLTTDATVVAFEPAPTNLFVLTSTLLALPATLRRRVWLFPIGLGDTAMESTINVDSTNRGNSVVGVKVQEAEGRNYLPPLPISVERLDDVIDVTKIPARDLANRRGGISLIKIDVQGFECGVVRGMLPSLLPSLAHVVMYENDPTFLAASVSPCSGLKLYNLFTQPVANGGANFMVHLFRNHAVVGDRIVASDTREVEEVQDLLAIPLESTLSSLDGSSWLHHPN